MPLRTIKPLSLLQAAVFLAAVVTVVLVADPVSPAMASGPTATMTPSRGLTDGEIVSVKGSGFPPFFAIQIMECSGTAEAPPKDNTSCQGVTLLNDAISNSHGQFVNEPHDPSHKTFGYPVFILPRKSFSPYPPICDKDHPCVVYVGVDEDNFSQPHVFVPFSFAGAPTPSSNGSSEALFIGGAVVIVAGGVGLILAVRRSRRRSAGS